MGVASGQRCDKVSETRELGRIALLGLSVEKSNSDDCQSTVLPVGSVLPDWRGAQKPEASSLVGRFTRLESLQSQIHGSDLWEAFQEDDSMWTYMAYGPFASRAAFDQCLESYSGKLDPLFFAVVPSDNGSRSSQQARGFLSLQRIDSANGVIEIAHVAFSRSLRRTREATEAVLLLIQHAWSLGYRRIEWKCDALNAASRKAAVRFGFEYEGTFRQAVVVKGRNRDTAWYSIIDSQRQELEAAYDAWLDPDNFDSKGVQKTRLSDFLSK